MNNVAIVQHGSSEQYAPMCWRINRLYCQQHGYEHIVIPLPDSMWAKVTLLKQSLPRFDAVLCLDNDAFVVDHSRPLVIGDKPLTCGINSFDHNHIFDANSANSGVVLAKRCDESFALLDLWSQHEHGPLNDQDALNQYVVPTDHVELLSDFGGRDGTFIRHLLLMPSQDRACILQAWLSHVLRRFDGGPGNPVQRDHHQ